MKDKRSNKITWLVFISVLSLLLGGGYLKYRQQVFEVLAEGSQWVLVTCGFEPEGEAERGENLQGEQLRKLYYAARMFNGAPPEELLPEDARAEEKYPGLGFGMVHTFSEKPVALVIGGWLFSMPCVYFADARNCVKSGESLARLKVSVDSLLPMTEATIDDFLAVTSPNIMSIRIAGLGGRSAAWWLEGPLATGYQAVFDTEKPSPHVVCTDRLWAEGKSLAAHCLLRFMHGSDVFVELKFAVSQYEQWPRLQRGVEDLLASFQVRR